MEMEKQSLNEKNSASSEANITRCVQVHVSGAGGTRL